VASPLPSILLSFLPLSRPFPFPPIPLPSAFMNDLQIDFTLQFALICTICAIDTDSYGTLKFFNANESAFCVYTSCLVS